MDGWQTMDSAPRDGTRVLLYSEMWEMTWGAMQSGYFADGEWRTGEGQAKDNEPGFDPNAEVDFPTDVEDEDWGKNLGPTHWMPLPAPPSEAQRRMGQLGPMPIDPELEDKLSRIKYD